jgi:hypothetical protein
MTRGALPVSRRVLFCANAAQVYRWGVGDVRHSTMALLDGHVAVVRLAGGALGAANVVCFREALDHKRTRAQDAGNMIRADKETEGEGNMTRNSRRAVDAAIAALGTPPTVKTTTNELDFRRKETSYADGWDNGKIRTAHFMGHCVLCGTRTYAFPDGSNDPRGILGEHAAATMEASDYSMEGPDVPACFMCQNDTEPKYARILAIAPAPEHMPDNDAINSDWNATRNAWGLANDD